ncbi:hypothetical protein V8G54_007750 [Vigna mungo]|uniref:Uncharacterized protein n=1 Tax=Vigna mungo TaxID=3915 RepID=A0AAQ3P2W0_VIGMU
MAELMLLGFISLLLTFGTQYIAKICIPASAGDIMLPCKKVEASKDPDDSNGGRKLLYFEDDMEWRRVLATASSGGDYCSQKVAFFRQFFASVTKVDYMTMRHGFINVGARVLRVP